MTESDEEYKLHIEYSLYLALAFVLTSLLYNVYLIFKIRYGSVYITKETLKPYYHSLAYLVIYSVEAALKCVIIENTKLSKKATNANFWNNADGNLLVSVVRILDSAKVLSFILFISSRTFAVANIYEFMRFQSGYRIEELDVVKEEFNRVEREGKSMKRKILWTYWAVTMFLTLLNCIFLINKHT